MKKLITILVLAGMLLTSCSDNNDVLTEIVYFELNGIKYKVEKVYIYNNGNKTPYKQTLYKNIVDSNYSSDGETYYYPKGWW